MGEYPDSAEQHEGPEPRELEPEELEPEGSRQPGGPVPVAGARVYTAAVDLVKACGRMRDDWAEMPDGGPERRRLWSAVHAAAGALGEALDALETLAGKELPWWPTTDGFVAVLCGTCGMLGGHGPDCRTVRTVQGGER